MWRLLWCLIVLEAQADWAETINLAGMQRTLSQILGTHEAQMPAEDDDKGLLDDISGPQGVGVQEQAADQHVTWLLSLHFCAFRLLISGLTSPRTVVLAIGS